jgi:pullulanase
MWISNKLAKSAISLCIPIVLSACGGSGSETPKALECEAPKVINDEGNACITPITNTAPSITSSNTLSVLNDLQAGVSVYSANGTDIEGDTLSWSLNDPENVFSIDSQTGEISVLDANALSNLNVASYSLTLTVSDGELSANLAITVTITDTSAAPQPSIVPSDSQAVIYYLRNDDNYDEWTIHAWNNASCNGYADFGDDGSDNAGTEWDAGLVHSGIDENYGAYWLIDTKQGETCLNYIIHSGDSKDPNDADQKLEMTESRTVFVVSGNGIYTDPEQALSSETPFSISDSAAHWIDETTLVWNQDSDNVKLVYSDRADLDSGFEVSDSNSISVSKTSLSSSQISRVPHLADWHAYTIDTNSVKSLLKQQLVLASFDQNNAPIAASYVQTAKVLDDVYTSSSNDADEQELGLVYDGSSLSVKVWAPTAKTVALKVYDTLNSSAQTISMQEDATTGIWQYQTDDKTTLDRKYYQFEISVYHPVTKAIETTTATDPYSVNTSLNGEKSQFVNMSDDDLKPSGWDTHTIPTLVNVEDAVLLEAHIRDVSAQDKTVTEANRGKYLAFTESGSDAMRYLSRLADAGVTHFHMLPANDIASINEDSAETFNINDTVTTACSIASRLSICSSANGSDTIRDVLESFEPTSTDAAQLIDEMRGYDSFNWGYDPHHFNAVEGSYASEQDGVTRIKEFREMVMALHEMGLRTVLDVVYNHTSSSGLYNNSVFDKLVPGYYHRYSEVSGDIERSTCCENTATENRMMGKFVIDSLVHWAEHLGMDGFRFDVMGHMPKDVILDGREAVQQVDPDTYFYGEGWNWGEVVNNRLFEQATQYNLADSKVGTFNDRPRDTIRKGALSATTVSLADADHIRLGLAGTLQNYELEDQNGKVKPGSEFSQSAYALTPADIINYVSKHDNETLWDALQLGLDTEMTASDRVRVFNISAAIPLLSQGIPFFQLGVDKMRSKSMHRNTYDFGDWYNFVDYTNSTNNWNIGLPSPSEYGYNYAGQQIDAGHGEGWKWPMIVALASNDNVIVQSTDIDFSESIFEEFLKIRSGSPLFRLTSEADVMRRVGFQNTGANQTPGLIVMSIDDGSGLEDLDAAVDAIVVVINGTDETQAHTVKTAENFELHSIQESGADSTVKQALFSQGTGEGTFSVPAYSIAVFVKPQSGAQGSGLNPDPDFVASPYGETEMYMLVEGSTATAIEYDSRGTYSANISLEEGTITFSIGDQNSSQVALGFDDVTIAEDSVNISTADGGDAMSLVVETAGTYAIELSVIDSIPQINISLVNALVSCAEPVAAGAAPFNIAGSGALFIRGDHSGWNAEPNYEMTYIGNNQYQAVADFSGEFQFKLASDDGSWSTQLWVQNTDGSINTNDLEVGTTYDVAYGNAGTSNNSMDVATGTYRFTLTLNESNPAAETKPAGSLIVEQCNN